MYNCKPKKHIGWLKKLILSCLSFEINIQNILDQCDEYVFKIKKI
jgi:hypothetical protein